jgi:hypothetical protein
MSDQIAERFKRDTAEHAMTVLHDDGLYRHLRFQHQTWRPPLAKPLKSSFYWFDLVTVPGALIFQGDGDSYVFRRLDDMFEFFRSPVGQVNPTYWSEKVVSGRDRIRTYDESVFRARVLEAFTDALGYGVPLGTGRALREQVLDNDYAEIHYEQGARDALNQFEHEGFRFEDTWEWDFRDYDWWFLWALHAIVWGIAYYDKGSRPTMPPPTPATLRRKTRPEPRLITKPVSGRTRRRIVDVELPAVAS